MPVQSTESGVVKRKKLRALENRSLSGSRNKLTGLGIVLCQGMASR